MNPQLAWHVARAAGLVAWALATVAVVWGLALSTRVTGGRPSSAWIADLHRFVGGLALTFTVVHVAALLVDGWVGFTLADVLVPFASPWRPAAVAWGVVALYVLVAVEATSLLRRHVPLRWWRRFHHASVPGFVAGTVHMLTAGTDATATWVRVAAAVATAVVVQLSALRILTLRRRARPGGTPATRAGRPSTAGS